MQDKEITLIQAIFGMGNANHDHVHRNNTFNLSPMAIDTLKMEQFQGGLKGTTLNALAAQAGGLSASIGGVVNIEDTWNTRRGIGLLRFHVLSNAVETKELSVLGYLTGGGASVNGILPETMFVPVRSWAVSTKQKQDNMGLPMPSTAIVASNQFLLGDPTMMRKLKAMRPMDVANETLGLLAVADDNSPMEDFDGMLGADLSTTVVSSKTQNLNPTHHARELLRVATGTMSTAGQIGMENAFSDSLGGASLAEAPLAENEFFNTMMWQLGSSHMLTGFSGWSVQEIMSVFVNFPQVLNLTLLESTNFASTNNLMDSSAYGSITDYEIIASEVAFMTVHLLMQVGLTHLQFSATNNPHDFGGLSGSLNGVGWAIGPFMSVLEADPYAHNRVEDFKSNMENQFFSKYATGYIHNSVIMSIECSCDIFGETSVAIFFNDDQGNQRRWVNATYCINRTSTNISANNSSMEEARNFMTNISQHFHG